MRRDSIHQELLTLGPFSLVGKGRIGWQPEVVVRIEMGTLEMPCQCSSQRGRPRARGSKDMDTMEHHRPSWVVAMMGSTTLATVFPRDTDTRNPRCLPP
jgi:hypothetical protein